MKKNEKSLQSIAGNKIITYLCIKKETMPTLFIIFGFRFQFYSNDHTPIHVHVVKGTSRAKYNLFPIELIINQGFKPSELKLIESIIEENVETISEHWNTYFNNNL